MSHLPTLESTDSSGSRRRRRAEASSSDESALGTFAISNLRDRVVTPPRPLPLESYGPHDGTEARRAEMLFGDEFERKAVELAREQSIPELAGSFSPTAGHMTAISLFDLGFDEDCNNPRTVYAGDDICAGRYIRRSDGKLSNPLVGTLGCWVEILVKDGGWRKMGLTCYHVVRPCLEGYTLETKQDKNDHEQWVSRSHHGKPVQDSDLWVADRKGLGTEGMARRVRVEHPARAKHNFTVEEKQSAVQHYQSQGASAKALKCTALLDESIAFFDRDEQFFGQVCFASGYIRRTKTNARLDWALIVPVSDNRIGGNPLPSLDDWVDQKYDTKYAPLTDEHLKPQGQSLYDCVKGDNVVHKVSLFKNGASTACTMGNLSKTKTDCVISEERYMSKADSVPRRSPSSLRSREFVVKAEVRRAGRFGDRGDSGAMVWDAQGRVVGMLFTGQQPHGTEEGYSLVTPIEDIFEDIKDKSGGNILDIRIPDFSSNEDVDMNSS
ncbi:hypothetical protein B0T24DRAFT_537214 [Lasiosphaeria ovina]|uniref:Uncharacterized protein n=1 Tax=Lasiosphaeria ovina TaxID=92902 RepID=A0AAE0JUQ4_9PEZI|nr:hypothetical protein B0T24DRAFT_537214 [Lasiosphaeria ovina]